jgi:nitrite reductase (NADH) small subunit
MAQERVIGRLSQIPPGEGRTFEVEGRRVAVFHTRAGQVFATQAECPHGGGRLADGLVGSTSVVCPMHEWVFDLATGTNLAGDCGLELYPVRATEQGEIMLAVSQPGTVLAS